MARISSAAVIVLVAAGLIGGALPAAAQFDSILGSGPPRPPADVPSQSSGRTNTPQSLRPEDYPADRQPMQQSGDNQSGQQPAPRAAQPLTPLPAPIMAPAAGTGRSGRTIQAQPLPPPTGTNAAPVEAGAPPATPPAQAQPQTAVANPSIPPAAKSPPGPIPTGTNLDHENTGLPSQVVVVEPPPDRIANPTAEFAGLDKITGHITDFDVKIGETVQFGALQVTPHACYSRPPTVAPRTDAFVDVDEVTLTGEIKRIFTGWMFASSPALHAVEHPIYDVWLTGCKGGKLNVAGADDSNTGASAQASPSPPKPTPRPPLRPSRRR